MKRILVQVQKLLKRKITIFKWQLNILVFVGMVFGIILGSYWGVTNIFKAQAVNDTIQTWTFNIQNANTFTYDTEFININDSGAHTGVNKLTNPSLDQDLAGWSGTQEYILQDEFTDTRAAGSLNGTAATPGPGVRTTFDTESKMSVGNGMLNLLGPKASAAWGDPRLSYSGVTREPGKVLVMDLTLSSTTTHSLMGYDTVSGTTHLQAHGFYLSTGGVFNTYDGGGSSTQIMSGLSAGVNYKLALVLKSTGVYYYVKGGAFPRWTLLWITSMNSTATLYPKISNYNVTGTMDFIRIPTNLWLPTPLAYDTFTRSDGSVGSTESTGPDNQTTERLAWSSGTIIGNKISVTPVSGADLLSNGNMEDGDPPTGWTTVTGASYSSVSDERTGGSGTKSIEVTRSDSQSAVYHNTTEETVGSWYTVQGWIKRITETGSSYLNYAPGINTGSATSTSWTNVVKTNRASAGSNYIYLSVVGSAGDTFRYDDVSIKPLTLSSLFSTVSTSDSDVIADANVTWTTGTQAGLVLNLDSTSNPQNFVIAYCDGANVKLEKSVAGVYTTVQTTAITYVAGAPLRVIKDGTKYRVYYNNVLLNVEQTISDTEIINNTNHGIFSTNSGNTFDNFTLWARGTGGEYTDIPVEDLTATYDTGIKYSGNGSAKLVAGGNASNFTQSINTGDTSLYSLITYAYTDGGSINGGDLTLYHDNTSIPTQYSSVGDGWYRLSGTISGAVTSKDIGVQVEAGKTVYVDEFLLYKQGEVTLTNSKFEGGVSGWSGTQTYLLQDEYTDTRTAGAVNGTAATPGPGTRTVTDANGKLSIGSGVANIATGGVGNGDPGLWYPSINRNIGTVITTKGRYGASDSYLLGLDSNLSSYPGYEGFHFNGSALTAIISGQSKNLGSVAQNVDYQLAFVVKSTGAYYYIKGGNYTNWTLLYISPLGSGASFYPSIMSGGTLTSISSSDYLHVPSSTWLPIPLAYDTFTRSDGTGGGTETTGPDGQTTPSLSWTGGSVSGNKMIITPTEDSEGITSSDNRTFTNWSNVEWSAAGTGASISDGNGKMQVNLGTASTTVSLASSMFSGVSSGKWVKASADIWRGTTTRTSNYYMRLWNTNGYPWIDTSTTQTNYSRVIRSESNGSLSILQTDADNGNNFYIDNVSIKSLSLPSLFSTLSTNTSNVLADTNIVMTSGTQAGLALNLDSTTNPQNFVIAYYDGRNVHLEKSVAGTYTSLINTSATYSSDATLRVIKDGTKYRVFYNNALVGSEQTISDASIINNTRHGLFSTYSGNTFDNFTLFARGTDGEYNDIPAEDLTVSYSTAQHHTGSGSAQLVSGGNNANYVQSINVGDTSTYSLVAYARTDGSAVTSGDLELYYNGSTLTTSYTDAGNGWYKLSGTFIGVASSKDLGVRMKANKTVYVDDISLYQQSAYSIFNTNGYYNQLVTSWDSFSSQVTTPGNSSIKYQVCTNDGSICEAGVEGVWKYWNGSVWTAATNLTTHTNTAAQLTEEVMQELDVLTQKISVKVIMNPDNLNFPNVASVSVGLTTDTTDPINASASRLIKSDTISCSYNDNCWTKSPTPLFRWTEGDDNQSGLKGYCLYLGTDEAGDPAHSKGKLGTSPNPLTGVSCQFVVTGEELNLATEGYLATQLSNEDTFVTADDTYYLNIKSVDYAGNTSDASETIRFKYDGTRPTNVSYISTSAGNFSNVVDMSFSWPTSGVGISEDSESEVLGWQYQINTTEADGWKGTTHLDEFNIDYIPIGTSLYNLTQERDGSSIVSGNNVVYFRTIDNAGNFSSDATVRTGNLSYGGQAPYFGGTDRVTVTPSTNTTNSYSLSWPEATPNIGNTVTHYYYSINTPPASTLATLQANISTYIDNGTSRTIDPRALPNVNKDENTVYVVAIDNASPVNYSPSNFITGTFTLNSTNPDNVGNLVASDSSIKSQSQWNVTLTWTAPVYQGAGNLMYEIYRSTDGETFAQVGTSRGLSYVDNAPESAPYFYRIVTKDGADAVSSGSNTVLITPTGRWTIPAELESQPMVTSITTKKAVVTWGTNRTSDSKVAFGTKSGVYNTEEPSNADQVSNHTITLSGLNPNTTYYYVSKWTDEDGNTGVSEEKIFKTQPAPVVKNVLAKNIGLTSSIIQFTSKGASKVKIYYGESTSFGGVKEIETSPVETTYTVELAGLKDGTKYYYRINVLDAESSEYEGTVLDFTTLPQPKISNVVLQEVIGTSQTTILVTWNTNTPVSSIITYYPEGKTDQARDEVVVNLTSGEHKMIIRGLLPQTNYYLVVKGRDRIGNEALSDSFKFTTSTDSRAPQMSNVTVEGSTATSSTAEEAKSQLIVSWTTDEPSTSQVEYGEGSGTEYPQKTQLDSNLTYNHLVIISGLTPSKVYHLRVISNDSVGNIGKSIDTVTIAPKSTDNALDLVILNLQQIFGIFGK